MEVTVNIKSAPESGVEHLAHIHKDATCEDDRNDKGGPVGFSLDSVEVDNDATGSSTTTIKDTTLARLFNGGKERYVNVDAKAEGAGVPPGIDCADLASPTGGERTTGEDTTGGKQSTTDLPKSGRISPVALLSAGAALALGAIAGFFALSRGAKRTS